MKKILVPIDGSPVSQKAAQEAIELSNRSDNKLIFVYVVDTRGIYTYDVGGIISVPFNYPKITEELIQVKTKFLDAFVSTLGIDGKNIEKVIMHGEPSDKIIEYARNEKVDLIVMGRRGFSKIQRFFVGSVTQRVVSDSPCPVLIINSDVE